MTDNALTQVDVLDQDNAAKVFRAVLGQTGDRTHALSLLISNPASALSAIQKGDKALGLSPKGSADILEEVLGSIKDGGEARELVNNHLTPERQVELLVARGDLPAIMADVVTLPVILEVIRGEMKDFGAELPPATDEESDDEVEDTSGYEENPGYAVLLQLRAWAYKVKDRPDYQEFLAAPIGNSPVRRWLLVAAWYECACPAADEDDIMLSSFSELGLEPQESQEEFRVMLESGDMPRFSEADLVEARQEMARRKQETEGAATVTDEVRQEMADAAEDIDI